MVILCRKPIHELRTEKSIKISVKSIKISQGAVAHTFNLSTQKAEAGGPELHREY